MPRLGVGMPITAGLSQEAVTTIDDFFFESHTSGEVTPINTATRSNLFTYSHDFSQSSWTKADAAVSASTVKNPFGESATAANGPYKLTTSSCTNQSYVKETITSGIVSGTSYTLSVYAKKAEYDYVSLVALNPTTIHYFNLANGTTAFAHSIQPVIEDAGNGWYRCSVTVVSDNSSSKFFGIYLAGDSGNISLGSVADGDGVYIYGAQIEQNAPVSALITSSGEPGTATTALSDTSEVWDFDSTDIMLEADPEDEGFWEEGSNLVLNHDYEELGSEKVNYPSDVSSITDPWILDSSTNKYKYVDSGSGTGRINFGTPFAVEVGQIYKVEVDITISSGNANMAFKSGNSQTSLFNNRDFSNGLNTFFTTVSGVNGSIARIFVNGNNTDNDFTLNSISVKQVDPNDRWALDSGWSIEDGKLKATSTDLEATQTNVFTPGNSYEITFTIDSIASGSVKVKAGTTLGSIRSSAGTYTQILDVAYGTNLVFDMHASGTCVIDNVTVKEYAVQPKDI